MKTLTYFLLIAMCVVGLAISALAIGHGSPAPHQYGFVDQTRSVAAGRSVNGSLDELNIIRFSATFEDTALASAGWVIGDGGTANNPTYSWGRNSVTSGEGLYSVFCANLNREAGSWTYPSNLRKALQSPSFNLTGATTATLRFSRWMNTEATNDYLAVSILDQNGSWHELTRYSGSAQTWQTISIPLTAYVGQTGLAIQFLFVSNGSVIPTSNAGVWLDAISVEDNSTATSTLTLTAPVGGENWLVGATQNITWNSTGLNTTDNIVIQINRAYNTGTWTTLTTVPNSGSYPWIVTGPGSTANRIKIYAQNNTTVTSTSNANFTITAGFTGYWISGYVRDLSSVGVFNVTMSGLPGTIVTNTSGYYEALVTSGWSGTVTPVRTGNTFTPPSINYTNVRANQTNQNYTSNQNQQNLTISGYVRNATADPVDGVTMLGFANRVITDSNGYYSATVPSGWSGTIAPSLDGNYFTPATRTYTALATARSNENYIGTESAVDIGGSIQDSDGNALPNVRLSGLPGMVVTDTAGNYNSTVPSGFSGVVTPQLSGWTFVPTTRTYTNQTAAVYDETYVATAAAPIPVTISGYVRDATNAAIANVVMSGFPVNTTTDQTGYYAGTVTSGWTGTVIPQLTGWTFTPTSRTHTSVTANQTNQNFTGTTGGGGTNYLLSGTVLTSTGTALSGVLISGLTGTVTTDSNGNYSTIVASGWSGTLIPQLTGYTFSPVSRTVTNVAANQTGLNFTAYVGGQTYRISGNIHTSTLTPIGGVRMMGFPDSVVTDVSGNYTATVPNGWTGTVTPTVNIWSFNPASRTYTAVSGNRTGDDYVATRVANTITGTVVDAASNPIGGVTLSGFPGTVTTDQNGIYIAVVTIGWSGIVTPQGTGWTFTPTTRTYTNVIASMTNENYTATRMTISLSGVIRDRNNVALSGVTLTGLPGTITTNTTGNYSATVAYGWSGVVTPQLNGWSFTPLSRTYEQITANSTTENYTAARVQYTISGTITDSSGVGIAGVAMNGFPTAVLTQMDGTYAVMVNYGWSGTVTPQLIGWSFAPASRTYTNVTASVSAVNYTGTAIRLTIAGNIHDANHNPVGAVLLSGFPSVVTTDANGNYSTSIQYGWSGIVTPQASGWNFTPASRAYGGVTASLDTERYVGSRVQVLVTGRVRLSSGQGVANVRLTGFPVASTTDTSGFYYAMIPFGWSGTVTPVCDGYTFQPVNRNYTNVQANRSDDNFTATVVPLLVWGWQSTIPKEFSLETPAPNPFNASTTLLVGVANSGKMTLRIYDMRGALITTLHEGAATVGYHRFSWRPVSISSGMYLIVAEQAGLRRTQKMIYLK